jgi:hypothetical protein
MNGRVGVESRLGEGSGFWIELPMAQGPTLIEPSHTPEIIKDRE